MARLIIVDREDGRAVAGLLTSVLANWERIPVSVQAAIIGHAAEAAFASDGRADGRYAVTAFILKHRAAMVREARWRSSGTSRAGGGFGDRARDTMETIASRRRLALQTAARLIRIDLGRVMASQRVGSLSRWWTAMAPRRPGRRRTA